MDMLSALFIFSSASLLFSLLSGVQAQQAFRTEPRNTTVKMGATAVLRCEVLRASGVVQWVKDGLLLGPERSLPGFPRYSMIGNPARGQYHLQIEKAELEDDAPYECQVGRSESDPALVSRIAQINVQIPPSSPYFEGNVTDPWVAGKKYIIICIAPDAKPEASVRLYKDGVELTVGSSTASGSKAKLLSTRAEATVVAHSSDDGRQLTCRAKNVALAKALETVTTMTVYYPPQPPVIEGLERDEIKAGQTLKLVCVSREGNPLASLQWTKNGEVVSTSWDEDTEAWSSSSVLYLRASPALNQAQLCCQSTNLVSPAPLSRSRTITVLFEPAKVEVSGTFEAIEGSELTLCCHATSSNPPVHIRWWLGFRELNNTVTAMEEGDNGGMTTTSNLTHHVSREENGLPLTCEAFNKGTRFSKSQTTHLNVYYPPQKVWLDVPQQEVPFRSGTKVRLVCFSTGGNPTGTLTWLKDGRPVPNALKQIASDKGVSLELALVLAPSDNMAAYRCDAVNEAKKVISAQTKLAVQFPAMSVKISVKKKVLQRGDKIDLDCLSGSSNPKANLSWVLGHHRLNGVEQQPTKAAYGGLSVLSRVSLDLGSHHHNQLVICKAYSSLLAEGASSFYKLNVLYPPEFGPGQPKQIQVLEDDTATLPLLVSGNPEEISCTWLHNKERILKERYQWSDDSSLEIANVTRRDAGVYTVQCDNEQGANHTSITLDVQYAPSVKMENDPVYVNIGGTADLMCVADANPVVPGMFSWKWLGEDEVEAWEAGTWRDDTGLLTIHNVTKARAGRYSCTADNGLAPPASAEVQLVVHFKPEIQKGPQWRKTASRGDGTTKAEVLCQAEGIPRVEFSWAKNGAPLDFANPRYNERTVREGSFHTSVVQVVNVSAALDYALFTCTASNPLGEDALDIQLVSTSHPDPPSLFRQVYVTHHSVTLDWIPGFDGGLQQRFRVRYRWAQSDSYRYVDVSPPTANVFTVTGLSPVTMYNFSVNALNAMGESGYADNGAVLTIATKEGPETDEGPGDGGLESRADALPIYWTVAFTAVGGVLLALNSLGCFLALRWRRKRRVLTGGVGALEDEKKSEKEGSSGSADGSSNRYESREKVNATAQRTLLVDSGSETDSNAYESYATESNHFYYPTADYRSHLYALPEEIHGHDGASYPAGSSGHEYDEVDYQAVYQRVLASPLPPPPSMLGLVPGQKGHWRPPPYPQGSGREREALDDRLPQSDSELPFELRGDLV